MDTSSPDVLAATYAPDAVTTVADLTEDDRDSVIEILGRTVTLLEVTARPPYDVELLVRVDGESFDRSLTFPLFTIYTLVTPPVRPADMIDDATFLEQARELDRLGALIEARDAEITVLKKRKKELSDRLLEYLAGIGEKNAYFDRRRVYLFPEAYPEFEQRDDGTKYTMQDLAPVLRDLGYGWAVKPEEAGYNALLKILREHEQAKRPLPAKLAAMVKLQRSHTVRVGVGKGDKSG